MRKNTCCRELKNILWLDQSWRRLCRTRINRPWWFLLVMSRRRMLFFRWQNLIVALPGEPCITRWLDWVFLVVIARTKHGTRATAVILNVTSPGLMIGKVLQRLRWPGAA